MTAGNFTSYVAKLYKLKEEAEIKVCIKTGYIIFYHRAVVRFARVIKTLKIFGLKNMSVGKMFDEIVKKHPNKVCFYFEDQEWTFAQVRL